MNGYFDESGSPALSKDGLFIVVGIWTQHEHILNRFMRKWLRKLYLDGYTANEIKGNKLSMGQQLDALIDIREKLATFIHVDVTVLATKSLVNDYRLFNPIKWSESAIHQAILYEMLTKRMDNDSPQHIAIDSRHSLPRTFFIKVQNILRKNYCRNDITVFRGISYKQRGIQLADFFSHLFYSTEDNEQSIIYSFIEKTKMNSNELLASLKKLSDIGGPL